MNPKEIKQQTMTMRSRMLRMLRDWEYWTAEDIETLQNEYYAAPASMKLYWYSSGQRVRYTKKLSSRDSVPEVRIYPAGEMALPKKENILEQARMNKG